MVHFDARIDELVRGRMMTRACSLNALLRSLPGVDPVAVMASLKRQGLESEISLDAGELERLGQPAELNGVPRYENRKLPTPHPLDYCWWFDYRSAAELLQMVRNLTASGSRTALLGIPTLFEMAGRALKNRGFVLVDSDPLVGQKLGAGGQREATVIHADLRRTTVVTESCDLVIADPPWYPEEMRAFLWTARQLCKEGGFVLTSVPPAGTRPGIEREWGETVGWTRRLGLALEKYREGFLRYFSPLFEQNAFKAASLPKVDGRWRQGDLAIFRCEGPCVVRQPIAPEERSWEERVIEDVRIRVRSKPALEVPGDTRMELVSESEFLSSVSRRDPRRELVDVWTSGNRVYRCADTTSLLRIIEGVGRRVDAVREIESSVGRVLTDEEAERIRRTERDIVKIVAAERQEIVRWRGALDG